METKQAQSYLSNNAKLNNCEKFLIPSSSKLINLCKIRANRSHSHQQKQGVQQQQQLNTVCFNAKDLQQFPWYLNKNTMFSYPRRRKSLRLRQGQKNSVKNCKNMLHSSSTDNMIAIHRDDEHLNAMKFNSFLLKSSSCIATKMWHNE